MANPPASRIKSWLRPFVAPAAALALTGLLAALGTLDRLDRAWFDVLQRRLAPRAAVPSDTVFVLIDEQSLAAMGRDGYNMRWPWPRRAFAALFAALHRAGARRIVGDFIFFEETTAEDDTLLGVVAAGLPGVTLGTVPGREPAVWPGAFRSAHGALFQRPRRGYVRLAPDRDGVIRRYLRGGSLVEAALDIKSAPDRTTPALLRWRGNLKQLVDRGVPALSAAPFVAAGLAILENATGRAPDLDDPTALVREIDREPAPEGEIFGLVRGKTVFVGANAAGAFDAVATPVGAPEPGAIVHWTAFACIAAGDFISDPGRWVDGLMLALAVALVGLAGRGGLSLRFPALAAGGAAALALGGSATAFNSGLWLAPALPVAGAAAAFTAVAVDSFRRERARKREIQQWFGVYVSPAVVRRLIHNPGLLRLGGERRELTAFFSDLAGFTTLSERLPPDELVRIVNAFLDRLSGCILDHGGYLDKYIGDAIMGVFGSPEELENHALSACRAALDSRRRLAGLNGWIEKEFGLRLEMRIGINTGEMIVGNVGSERKKNYTVLGDAVNLASRLEGANKEFGTAILLGPVTAARVAGMLATRPVALLRVKGKEQAVPVHELIGEPETLDDAARHFLAAYTEGFDAFRARDFDRAVRSFEAAAAFRLADFLTNRYLDEARALAAAPPAGDWEPVLKLESK